MNKNIFLIIILFIAIAHRTVAINDDAGRGAAIYVWNKTHQKALSEQSGAMMLMTTAHIWANAEQQSINEFHQEFCNYLDSLHNYLVLAASGYGLYLEGKQLYYNIQEMKEVVVDGKKYGNVVAAALSKRTKFIYAKLLTTGGEIINDITQTCFSGKKMSEMERYLKIAAIRPKIHKFNKELCQLNQAVRYTTMIDVWNEWLHKSKRHNVRSKKELAYTALDRWRLGAQQVRDKAWKTPDLPVKVPNI